MLPKRESLQFRLMLWCIYIIVRLISSTWRVRIVGMDRRIAGVARHPKGAFMIASFHEWAMAGVLPHRGQGISCLTSQSKDGEMVAFILERIGLHAVRGSSSRGGKEARDEMRDLLLDGHSCSITVDGPKGPRRKVKSGIIDLARKTGAGIIPLTSVSDNFWLLHKTWDQTKIPKPFSRVLLYYGEAQFVADNAANEAFEASRLALEAAMAQDADNVPMKFQELWLKGQRSF